MDKRREVGCGDQQCWSSGKKNTARQLYNYKTTFDENLKNIKSYGMKSGWKQDFAQNIIDTI